jgi:hypothetical protein
MTNRLARVNTTTGVWNPFGTSGNGTTDTVYAMVANGTDIYVGGAFFAVGNIVAYGIAKFDTLTNTWSALGTSSGNGVNNAVLSLALNGDNLYEACAN